MRKKRKVTPQKPKVIEARIERVIEMVTRSEWKRSDSSDKLSKEWGISRDAVASIHSEACRAIRRGMGSGEDYRTQLLQSLDHLVQSSFNYHRPDFKAIVKAHELQAKLLGLVVNKVETTVSKYEHMSDGKLMEQLTKASKKLKAIDGGKSDTKGKKGKTGTEGD